MPGRAGRPWRRVVAAALARDGYVCRTRWDAGCTGIATTGDHIIPYSIAPHLELSLDNVISACAHCNLTRQAKSLSERPTPPTLRTTRTWG